MNETTCVTGAKLTRTRRLAVRAPQGAHLTARHFTDPSECSFIFPQRFASLIKEKNRLSLGRVAEAETGPSRALRTCWFVASLSDKAAPLLELCLHCRVLSPVSSRGAETSCSLCKHSPRVASELTTNMLGLEGLAMALELTS